MAARPILPAEARTVRLRGSATWIARIDSSWVRAGGVVLALVALHALLTAALRLAGALDALLSVPDAPIDLLIRMGEVRRWFAGVEIYSDPDSANYPPGSYVLLWPLLGWLPEGPTRVLYALSIAASLLAIAVAGVRASGAKTLPSRTFMAVFVLPLGATQITVWIGQLGLHVVACLLAATLLLFGSSGSAGRDSGGTGRARWPMDLLASALLAVSLVKPTLSAPVVAVILIAARRWRTVGLTAGIYLGVTLLAAAFQESSVAGLVGMWLGRESIMNLPLGSVNTHLWLHWLGFEGSMLPVSLAWLLAAVIWAWRHADADPWILVGVSALVGRLWIHHRAFDDVLLAIPMIVLFRIAAGTPRAGGAVPIIASVLLGTIYGLGHAPWSYLNRESPSLWLVTELGRTLAWAGALAFLLWHARRPPSPAGAVPTPNGG
jgi:hypothetical protein